MKVEIIINNIWSRIKNLNDIKITDILDNRLSFYVEGYQYTRAFKHGWYDNKAGIFRHWDGKRHLLTNKMVFPTGLLPRIKKFLKSYKIDFKVVDQRNNIVHGKELKIYEYKPRYYQKEALEVALKNERGIIRAATGSGKTVLAAMITAKYNVPTMIYVVGKDLLHQFHREFEKCLGIKIGIIGDNNCDIQKINICSIWTAITAFNLKTKVSLDDEDWTPEIINIDSKQKKLIKNAIQNSNLAIYDEAHFLATDTVQSIFKASKNCRYLFGLSGTDWRDDGTDLLLESICGERIYNLPASKLIEEGYLVTPKIILFKVPKYHTKLSANYSSVYKKYITENDIRNKMIENTARKLISDGRKVLILVRFLPHGDNIAKRLIDIPLYFVNGSVDSRVREEVKRKFELGELKCLIASSVFDIGVDIPSLDALILGCGGKSTVRTLQRLGRVIRTFENKTDAFVVDFIDDARYLDEHSSIRIAVYKTEHRFKIKFPKDFNYEELKKPKIAKKLRVKMQNL
jgi:superfamily II DNA or RNA helicase